MDGDEDNSPKGPPNLTPTTSTSAQRVTRSTARRLHEEQHDHQTLSEEHIERQEEVEENDPTGEEDDFTGEEDDPTGDDELSPEEQGLLQRAKSIGNDL